MVSSLARPMTLGLREAARADEIPAGVAFPGKQTSRFMRLALGKVLLSSFARCSHAWKAGSSGSGENLRSRWVTC